MFIGSCPRLLIVVLFAVCALTAEDYASLKVEQLATGFPGAEGPVWSREGFLLFSDFSTSLLHRYNPGKGVMIARKDTKGGNGNTFDRHGRLYTCEYQSRRVIRIAPDGKIEVIADRWNGKRLNAPNDIVVRRDDHRATAVAQLTQPRG